MDEVGRGPLAGPVVAAAVVLDPQLDWRALRDSKQLTARRRAQLSERIRRHALAWAVGYASPAEIDQHNILQASMLAMQRAVIRLSLMPAQVLVDGNRVPDLNCPAQAIVGGDKQVPAISAASIVAKHARDEWMRHLDMRFPQYGFARHVGYATRAHVQALGKFGVTPLHRFSFAPVRRCLGRV